MEEMNICIFGDSIAYGAYDEEKGGWVNRLRLHLDNKTDFDGEIYNLSVAGDDTEEIMERLGKEAPSREPDLIIFAVGINDSRYLIKEKRNRMSLEEFENNIKKIISKAKTLAPNLIFVGLMPVDENKTTPIPWDTNAIYKNSSIEKYDGIIKRICEEEKIQFIDLYSEMIKLDYKKILYDGLHPNWEGHQWIAEKMINELAVESPELLEIIK